MAVWRRNGLIVSDLILGPASNNARSVAGLIHSPSLDVSATSRGTSPRGRCTNQYGSTGPSPRRYTPKWRCGGVVLALPVLPTNPSVSPTSTCMPDDTAWLSGCEVRRGAGRGGGAGAG